MNLPETTVRFPEAKPQRHNALTRFLFSGSPLDIAEPADHTHPWYLVLWLTGVDYFSTIGYQPGIALLAAGALSVPATGILVLVTVFGAVPIYSEVAARSYAGQGSIALLENLFSGWKSKIFVLILLGFAATDFVITMTLSAADAARHATQNPYLHRFIGEHTLDVTLILLALLAIVFIAGFREAIVVVAATTIPYIALNIWVLLYAGSIVYQRPELLENWTRALHGHGDWTAIFVASALVFPKLALGLSGFETGVSVMPLVNGGAEDQAADNYAVPAGRILNTRKLLVTAAAIMSILLLLSSFVSVLLIPESAYQEGGPANGRAIAYLAHEIIGNRFGSFYDLSTILVLWLAGASAMTGLLNLIPRYLPRFGMAPPWVAYRRPLVLLLLAIDVIVTVIFKADVDRQGSAYATGVLVLMFSAAVAVALALSRESSRENPFSYAKASYYWIVTIVFAYTLVANVIERPDGVIIASCFILLLLVLSAVSRYLRATEMRVSEFEFVNDESEQLWNSLREKKINLIPHHADDAHYRAELKKKVQSYLKLQGRAAFLYVRLMDNRSEFYSCLRVQVRREGEDYVIDAHGATAIANTIAFLADILNPISVVLGLTERNLMTQALAFVLFGEGEIGLVVYSVLVKFWHVHPKPDHPLLFLISG
ncbi:MAG: hypothetical protein DMG60_02500 [Acidobacteria bacterium]|nr:MAG: hypothetical protein DMG60_02500 [Acidobacteriota bacterium]